MKELDHRALPHLLAPNINKTRIVLSATEANHGVAGQNNLKQNEG